MKYRKKPVVIEATQWFKNGDHPKDGVGENATDPIFGGIYKRLEGTVVRFYRTPGSWKETCKHCKGKMDDHGWIDTLEGGHTVCPGDWVITGVKGEMYPCKPDIFTATYDPVSESRPTIDELEAILNSEDDDEEIVIFPDGSISTKS
jgi:hypothetical protein